MSENSDLLLQASSTFKGSNIIDRIRQSCIDLNNHNQILSQRSIINLLNESLSYLDNEISLELVNELFNLIHSCFSYLSTRLIPAFDLLLQKSNQNSFRIIITASIISYLIHKNREISLEKSSSFIIPSIQNINQQIVDIDNIKKNITVFDHEIPFKYQTDLLLDLISSTKWTKELVYPIIRYLNFQPNISSNHKFIALVINGLPKSLIPTENSENYIDNLIPYLSDNTFIEIFSKIEEKFITSSELSKTFIIDLLQKCSKVDKKLSNIEKVLDILSDSDITPEIGKFLIEQGVELNEKNVEKFKGIKDSELLFNLSSEIPNIQTDLLVRFLLSKPDFFIQTYSFYSNEENKCTSKLYDLISTLFNKYVDKDKTNQFINELFLSVYPPTVQGVTFLKNFFRLLNKEIKDSFHSIENMNEIISKIIEKRVIPHYSFAELFLRESLLILLQRPNFNSNPLFLYLFRFSSDWSESDLSSENQYEITVLPGKEKSYSNLVDFIQDNNYDSIVNFNEECLSLVSCALLFSYGIEKYNVSGLTKENIVLFYSIVINNIKNDDFLDSFDSPELLVLLFDGIEFIRDNQSPEIITSINLILKKLKFAIVLFNDEIESQIVYNLIQILLKNQFFGDKRILFSSIIEFSRIMNLSKEMQVEIIQYYIKNISEINFKDFDMKFSLEDFDQNEISQFFIDSNLLYEKIYFFTRLCVNVPPIKYEPISDIEKILLEKINTDDALVIFDFMINNKYYSELNKFIKMNEIDISNKILFPPNLLSIDKIISVFLLSKNPEENEPLIKALFNKMILINKSNLIGYLTIKFENMFNNQSFTPKKFLKLFSKEYNKFDKKIFFKCFNNIFVKHPEKNIFVKRATKNCFHQEESEINQRIITRLFNEIQNKENNYQAFFCLRCIASTFPFIFESNPHQIFDVVFPKLNDYVLIYDEQYNIEKAKTALAALYFLISSLNSNKIIDSFIKWSFNNVKNFTDSQTYCFILIISLIIKNNKKIQTVLVPLLIKYNFQELFTNLLNKVTSNDTFGVQCNRLIFSFLSSYYKLLNDVNKFDAIFIDEYTHVDNVFCQKFLNCISHMPYSMPNLNFLRIEGCFGNDELLFFAEYVKNAMPYKINYKYEEEEEEEEHEEEEEEHEEEEEEHEEEEEEHEEEEKDHEEEEKDHEEEEKDHEEEEKDHEDDDDDGVEEDISIFSNDDDDDIENNNDNDISIIIDSDNDDNNNDDEHISITKEEAHSFITEYNKSVLFKKSRLIKSPLPDIPSPLTTNMVRYITLQPHWISQYILYKDEFPILSEHHAQLTSVINELCKMKNNEGEEDDDLKDFSSQDFFLDQYCQSDLFKITFEKILSNENESIRYCIFNFLGKASKNGVAMISILQFISQNLIQISSSSCSMRLLERYLDFLFNMRMNETFKNNFADLCGESLINVICFPQYRSIKSILLSAYKICIKSNCNLPIRASYLVGFMILNGDDKMIEKAIKLCSKFDKKDLTHMSIIQDTFDKEIKKANPSLKIISGFMKYYPSACSARVFQLFNLFKFFVYQIKSTNDFNNEIMVELILLILNFILPKRELSSSFGLSDSNREQLSQKNPNSSLYPIPDYIFESNTKFWTFIDENRELVNTIIMNQIEKNKLNEFIMIDIYPEIFSFEIKTKYFQLKMNKKLDLSIRTNVTINPNDVLNSSFNELYYKDHEYWLYNFSVDYVGERGVDLGGLRRDWLTKLSRELFNPFYGLFECTEKNRNYQPSPLSYANPLHLEFFNFAGKIVARSLMQGELLDAHFTRSFLKSILHQKVKFQDLEDTDEVMFTSLTQILKQDLDNDEYAEYYFELNENKYGQFRTIELKENGSEIKVTNENKNEYVYLYSKHRMRDSIIDQITSFCEGFNEFIKREEIRIFTPNELNLLICGVPQIDVEDLRKNIEFDDDLNENSPLVRLFFDSISKWDQDNLAKLLMFITGSSQMPSNGFKYFKDKGIPIKISDGGPRDRLPVAHTCFNTLELPHYETEDELNQKFVTAINENTFQLA